MLKPVFGGTDGSAGTIHDKWRIVNKDNVSCSVSGFPAVTNYRLDGRPRLTPVTETARLGR